MNADEILLAMSSSVIFAETYFKSPNDPDTPLKLRPYQRTFMNIVDFGYDISVGIKPTHPVREVVLKTARQMGKTTAIAALAAAQALRFPNAGIAIASIAEDRAQTLLSEIISFIKFSPFADWIVKSTKDRVILDNGSIIKSHPQSASIRGTSNDWMYFDEAGYMTDRFILEDASPSVRSKGRFHRDGTPDIIMASTPPDNMSCVFVKHFVNGLNRREVVCLSCGLRDNVNSSLWKDVDISEFKIEDGVCPNCGSPDLSIVYNTVASLSASPFDNPDFNKEDILAELDLRGNTAAARRELLGEIVSDASSLIRPEWIEACTDPTLMNYPTPPSLDLRYAIGLDYGRVKDATVLCTGHKFLDKIYLDHILVLPGKGGVSYGDIRKVVLSEINEFRPYLIVPDSTGIGNPLVEQLQHDIVDLSWQGVDGPDFSFAPNPSVSCRVYSNKRNHLGFYFDYNAKLDLIDNLINLFQLHRIRIPPSHIDSSTERLHRELRAFNYVTTQNGRIKYGVQYEHDDAVIALALMAWGLRESTEMFLNVAYGGEDDFTL